MKLLYMTVERVATPRLKVVVDIDVGDSVSVLHGCLHSTQAHYPSPREALVEGRRYVARLGDVVPALTNLFLNGTASAVCCSCVGEGYLQVGIGLFHLTRMYAHKF